MPALSEPELLDGLAPTARRATPRARIAVGGAVVLFIAAVAAAAVLSFVAVGGGSQPLVGPSTGGDATPASSGAGVQSAPLLVHVLGEVASPGLVELAAGSRVVDAVAAAGGFTPSADPAAVNLARAVVDGEQLVVLAVGQAPPPGAGAASGGAAATDADGTVHLNTADLATLDTLPRIGPALAQRIIDWRDANGPFTSTDQLLDVAGIGDAVFAGLEGRVVP